MKRIVTTLAIILISMSFFPFSVMASDGESDIPEVYYYKGNVLRVETITYEQDTTLSYDEIIQISEIEILDGEFQGRVYTIENKVKYSDPQQIVLHVGDDVMLSVQLTDDVSEIKTIHIYDYYRITQLIVVAIISLILLIGITWLKGLRSALSVGIVALSIYFYFIPLMQAGNASAILMIPICLVIMFINVTWDLGMNTRGFAAMIGVASGIMLAGLSGYFVETVANLVGLGETELSMLYYVSDHVALDYTTLFTACVMLIAVGPIINCSIDMIQKMHTLKENNPYIGRKKMFLFGLHAGQEHITRNINTVFFVLIACMLPMWIVFDSFSTPFVELINMDVLSIQLFRGFAAMIGILLSVPITALVFSRLSKRNSLY